MTFAAAPSPAPGAATLPGALAPSAPGLFHSGAALLPGLDRREPGRGGARTPGIHFREVMTMSEIFRRIDVSGEKPVAAADMPAPMLDWLPIEKLVVDDRYQRPLGPQNWTAIRKIAASFRWSRFTPVLVAPVEDGLFAIIDGQHRVHAAALCGFKTVPAMAVHMTRAEQATSFAWVNGQVTRISALQIYRAALAAGEEWAVRANAAVEAAGCRLMTSNASTKNKKARQVFTIGPVRAAVAAGRDDAVTAVLDGLRRYDKADRVALWSDYIIRPLLAGMLADRSFRTVDVADVLEGNDPFRVIEVAQRLGQKPPDAFVALFRRHLKGRAA